jgi:ABC-type multidrug transport system fused ATPase/permease subunit
MPLKIDDNEENIQRLINIAGATFYPLALTLLMPLFMYNIVIEKEKRLIEIMKINGLKMFNFWIGYMITDYVIYLITILVFSLVGIFILKLTLFINTSFILLFVLFILWGFNQIGLAFFFQSFVNNARSTTIIGYMVSLWTTLIAVSLNFSIYDIPNKFPIILLYYPTFNLCRIFYYMTYHCGYYTCLNNIYTIEQEVKNCYFILFISGFVYIILGMYLYEIIPQEFGIRKHPLFFIKNLFQCNKNINEININKNNINFTYKKLEEENLYDNNINDEDDLTKEQKIINNIIKTNTIKNYPLIVTNLTKIYNSNKNNYKSLDNFSLCLENNKIFSLLGPNGAGKTTFFSILTGIFPPTSGKAYIKGYSILTDIEKCQEQIGFCPQFDLLWNDLTVYEHLYFYCLFKNVDISNINDNIIKTLSDIKLEKFKNFLVR